MCIRMIIVLHCSLYNLGKVKKELPKVAISRRLFLIVKVSMDNQEIWRVRPGVVPVFFPLVNFLPNEISNEQATAKTKFAVKPSVALRR